MSECTPDCKYKQKYLDSKYKKFYSRCYEYISDIDISDLSMETLCYRLEKYGLLHYAYELDGFDNTLLHYIAYSLNTTYLDKLTAINYDFNIKDPLNNNAFNALNCMYDNDIDDVEGFTNMIKALCKYGTDINHADNNGDTFLHKICKTSFMCGKITFTTIVKVIREVGGSVNIKNNDGYTPYDLLVSSYFTQDYEYNDQEDYGSHVLKYMHIIYKEQLIELTLDYMFDLLEEEDLGWNILMGKLKEQDKLDYILDGNYWTNTLLHHCVYNLDEYMINLLYSYGYNINIVEGYKGVNALKSLFKYIKDNKITYSNQDKMEKIINIKRLLCKNGIDINHVDNKGRQFVDYVKKLRLVGMDVLTNSMELFEIYLDELIEDSVDE